MQFRNHQIFMSCPNVRFYSNKFISVNKDTKRFCRLCPLVHKLLTRKEPARILADRLTKGPDRFISSTLSDDLLQILQVDKMGLHYIVNELGSTKVFIIVACEVVTRQVYLISMREQSTVAFIQSLEILQQLRGKLSKVIVDLHPAHLNLESNVNKNDEQGAICVSPTLIQSIKSGETNLLNSKGISIILAQGKNHSKIGLYEQVVFNIKKLMVHLFPRDNTCQDIF